MRFGYTYQDREGRVHEDEIGAPSKAEAYSALRQHGVRPMKVWELESAPVLSSRFKARAVALAAVLVATAIGAFFFWYGRTPPVTPTEPHRTADIQPQQPLPDTPAQPPPRRPTRSSIESPVVEVRAGERIARPRPRRQLDLANVEPEKVFAHPAEVFFARFAQPGATVPHMEISEELQDDFYDAIEDDIMILNDDSKPVADLKRVVAGIKQEAAARLSGGGSFADLAVWLEGRQRMEAEYRTAIIAGPGNHAQKNAQLRAMGLAEIAQ